MNIFILLSTLNSRLINNRSLLSTLEKVPHVVVNQGHNTFSTSKLNVLQSETMGLTKSRNQALENTPHDAIGIIADDDLEYVTDFKQLVLEAYNELPDADIISFQIGTPEGDLFRKYPSKIFKHSVKTLLSVASVEITFKTSSVFKAGLKFDERFGAGTDLACGEEAIFLNHARKKGLKIYHYPKTLCIHPKEAGGNTSSDKKILRGRVMMIKEIFGVFSLLFIILFWLRNLKVLNVKSLLFMLGFFFRGR